LEIYRMASSESKFVNSYFELIKELRMKFNLSDVDSKEVVCIVSEWLSENKLGKDG